MGGGSVPDTDSLTAVLARFTVGVPSVTRPPGRQVSDIVFDTVGVALAGAHSRVATAVRDTLGSGPGHRCTLFGSTARATAVDSAFANAVSAHALDYDDMSDSIRGHLSCIVVPAFFAYLEAFPAADPDVPAAYAVALRVASALAQGVNLTAHYGRGWHSTATLGGVAAAAGICRLARADQRITRNAIGIAASAASGYRQNFGTDTKPLHAGAAAAAAIRAVLLARQGVTADPDSIGGSAGFLAVFGLPADPAAVAQALDQRPSDGRLGVNTKLLPCCYELQRAASAALELHQVMPDARAVADVLVTLHPHAMDPLLDRLPRSDGERPFSVPYVVAYALRNGEVPLTAMSPCGVLDRDVAELAGRVRVEESPQPPFGTDQWSGGFACVEVTPEGGRRHRVRIDAPPGHATRPATAEVLQTKVADCLANGEYEPAVAELASATTSFTENGDPRPLRRILHALEECRATRDARPTDSRRLSWRG
jgi:2-methylcitrate dehydratase PrpD